MPTWEYLVLRALKAGERTLQPGELTSIPNDWTHQVLQAHLNAGLIEKIRLLEDQDYQPQPYPTGAPENYDDLKPTPPPRLAGSYREDVFTGEGEGDRRFRSKEPLTWIRCFKEVR